MNLIEAKNICKQFGRKEVVTNINLEIKNKEVVALIGTNGAGKSTTLSMLLGILPPNHGTISHWRKDFKMHTGVQLQSTPFFESYTTEENLRLFAALYGLKLNKSQVREKLRDWDLEKVRNIQASRLSGGQQKKLAIAVATLHNPTLIVLDEPAAGLDPHARQEIRERIHSLAQNGKTILFSSHDMTEVSLISDRIILMHEGTIVAQGELNSLLKDHHLENLESLYLKLTDKKTKEISK